MRRWHGIGLEFILILSIIGFSAVLTKIFMPLQQISLTFAVAAAQLPDVAIQDHKLSIEHSVPYTIDLSLPSDQPDNPDNKSYFIIDTAYKVSDLGALSSWMAEQKVTGLCTEDTLIIAPERGKELRVYTFKSLQNMTISHDQFVHFASQLSFWLTPVLIISLAIGTFIGACLKILCGAVIVLLLNLFTRITLEFPDAMRMAGVAAIPPAIVFLFFPGHPWLKFFLWLAYIEFGIQAVRKSTVLR
jgi:hypothetical protein